MTFLEIVMLIIYLALGFFFWVVFTCWLHDTNHELNRSWFGAMFVAIALAFVWPVSLVMLYFYERGKPDNSSDGEIAKT